MSWSVACMGKPLAVKAALEEQFANAKKNTASVPHEQEAVALIERIVNAQLDFLADLTKVAVKVEARGSAYKSGATGSSSVTLDLQPIYGWVE